MTKSIETQKQEFLAIITPDLRFRFVFSQNEGEYTAKGLPRTVFYALYNATTGAKATGGGLFFTPPNWDQVDLTKKLLDVLKESASRLFFKTIIRKPELIQPWLYHDNNTLRETAGRFVAIDECIDIFFKDVMKTERLRRYPSEEQGYFVKASSEERMRGQYRGYDLRVTRKLNLFSPSSALHNVVTTYEFRHPNPYNMKIDVGTLSLSFKYPPAKWPTLKTFLTEQRVTAMLDAWIDNVWTDEQRNDALSK